MACFKTGLCYYLADKGFQHLGEASETLHHDFLLFSVEQFSGSQLSPSVPADATLGRNDLAPRSEETE